MIIFDLVFFIQTTPFRSQNNVRQLLYQKEMFSFKSFAAYLELVRSNDTVVSVFIVRSKDRQGACNGSAEAT